MHRALGACADLAQATLVELARERVLRDAGKLAQLVCHVESRVARDVVGDIHVHVRDAPEAAQGLEGEVVGVAGNRAADEHAGLAEHPRGRHAHEDAVVGAVRLGNAASLRCGDERAFRLGAGFRRHGVSVQGVEDLVGGEDTRDHRIVEVCERAHHGVHEELVAVVARGQKVAVGDKVDLAAHGLEAKHEPVAHKVRARREVLLGHASVPAYEALACRAARHATPPRCRRARAR